MAEKNINKNKTRHTFLMKSPANKRGKKWRKQSEKKKERKRKKDKGKKKRRNEVLRIMQIKQNSQEK